MNNIKRRSITITSKEATRYFMTVQDAVNLLLKLATWKIEV